MIERVYLLFEVLAIILGLWALHGTKKKPTIATVFYVCVELIVVSSVELGWLPPLFLYVLYIGIIILCIFEFNDKVYEACIYCVLELAMLSLLQMIFALLLCSLFQTLYTDFMITMLINMITCAVLLVVFLKCDLHKYVEPILKSNIAGKIILIGGGLIVVYIFIISRSSMQIYWKDAILIVVFAILVFSIVFQWQKEMWLNRQKAEELKAYQKYNLIYQDLISDVRRKQHEFNNHVRAISSMNLLAKDLDDLIERQNEYCSKIMKSNAPNKLLRADISSVFAGFLYTKITQAEGKDITVKYQINLKNIEEYISFLDLVEITGNLFDNAMDAMAEWEGKKMIEFAIHQSEESLAISISNPYFEKKTEKLEGMLEEGKSSKGKGRGLGLANVKKLVDKYHGSLDIKVVPKMDADYILFRIIMPL